MDEPRKFKMTEFKVVRSLPYNHGQAAGGYGYFKSEYVDQAQGIVYHQVHSPAEADQFSTNTEYWRIVDYLNEVAQYWNTPRTKPKYHLKFEIATFEQYCEQIGTPDLIEPSPLKEHA